MRSPWKRRGVGGMWGAAAGLAAVGALGTVVAVDAVGALRALGALGVGAAAGPPSDVRPEGGAASPGTLLAQEDDEGPAYDGRFTFLRVRFGPDGGRDLRSFGGFRRGREPLWAHDSPRAERNFSRILLETTTLDPYLEGGKVAELSDPELFRYPIAYIVEVGYWRPSEDEVAALREYLMKGGFLIVDDFRGGDIYNFQSQMGRVLPGLELQPLDDDHPVFDAFFHIEDPDALVPPTFQQYVPVYLGIFEDDDPSKRLMVVANYNNDIAEYWEYSDRGFYPIALSNDAYKFGVNYVIYGMTH